MARGLTQYGSCVDLSLLAKDLKVEIKFDNLAPDVGAILRAHPNRQIICNKNIEGTVLRLVIAHKLSHFILHPHYTAGMLTAYHYHHPSKMDAEATELALKMLIQSGDFKNMSEAKRYFLTHPQTELGERLCAAALSVAL